MVEFSGKPRWNAFGSRNRLPHDDVVLLLMLRLLVRLLLMRRAGAFSDAAIVAGRVAVPRSKARMARRRAMGGSKRERERARERERERERVGDGKRSAPR